MAEISNILFNGNLKNTSIEYVQTEIDYFLRNIAETYRYVPNMLFIGPHNTGKNTLIHNFINMWYTFRCKSDVHILEMGSDLYYKIDSWTIQLKTTNKNSDKNTIYDILEEHRDDISICKNSKKIVIINISLITEETSDVLIQLFEKYQKIYSFIMIALDSAKINERLLTRTMIIRTRYPTENEKNEFVTRLQYPDFPVHEHKTYHDILFAVQKKLWNVEEFGKYDYINTVDRLIKNPNLEERINSTTNMIISGMSLNSILDMFLSRYCKLYPDNICNIAKLSEITSRYISHTITRHDIFKIKSYYNEIHDYIC